MKRFLLSSAVVLALTVAGGTVYKAAADTASPSPGMDQSPGPPAQCGGPQRGWGAGGRGPGGFGFGKKRDAKFGLFVPAKDKNLSSGDVKIIATALLLEHGNHDWSVSNIVTEPDKSIGFSFDTQHGDVVAMFTIDPASGRIKRVS